VTKADQLAKSYHAKRLIMVADRSTRSQFRYFTEQLPLSSTVVDDTCLLLPGPSTGPAVVLVPPYETLIEAFFATNGVHVVHTETSKRLGGAPFRLYVVEPLPKATEQTTLSANIQLVNAQSQSLQKRPFAVIRWNVLQAAPASDRTTYIYQFTYTQLPRQICTFTNVQRGEQLVTLLPERNGQGPLSVRVEQASTTPHAITVKRLPFLPAFDTFQQDVTPFRVLKSAAGGETVTILAAANGSA
jgi:hypothetical protein